MFKRMKRRLVAFNMLLLAMIFLIIFLSIGLSAIVSSYQGTQTLLDRTLAAVHPSDGEFRQFPKRGGVSGGIPMNAISIRCTEDGSILNINTPPQADQALVRQLLALALGKEKTRGYLKLGTEVFAFGKEPDDDLLIVVLLDQQTQMASIRNTLLTLLAIGAIGLIVLFWVSVFFAERTIRPVRDAYEKQEAFVADASHELKTPLAIIAANLSVLRSDGQPAESREKWFRSSEQQIRKMTDLINDMLLLASFRDRQNVLGKSSSLPAEDFSQIITGLLLSFEVVTYEKHLPMESRIQPDIRVRGDEADLSRLASTLVDNAVKYAGEVDRVEVTLTREQGKAIFCVRNQGTVIPPEHLPHLFDRFYRVDSARNQRTGGSGLGLSIARSIAQSLGGEIRAESSAETGTAFTVTLPLA